MESFAFEFKGVIYSAVDACWEKNGEAVYDILDENGELVDSITVHPFEHVSMSVEKWVETESCFA